MPSDLAVVPRVTNPARELAEEFDDTLKINLTPEYYVSRPVATIVENEPAQTANIHARGYPTVRIFRAFEAIISDSSLAQAMTMNSARNSDQVHRELAWRDYQNGGKGQATAVLALPLKQIMAFYSAVPIEERSAPILFEQHQLDETVPAILEGITVPKYQRLRYHTE